MISYNAVHRPGPLAGQESMTVSAPRYFTFTKKGQSTNNVAVQVTAADNFTAVLDEDGQVTIIGVSPFTHAPVREMLFLPEALDEHDIPKRLRHLSPFNRHEAVVHPMLTICLAFVSAGSLGNFIFMVRKDQILTTAMNVN